MTQREEKLDAHICLMQLAMQEYLVPDGSLDADAFINRMIELLDGPEQREAQAAQPPSTTEWTLIAPDGTLFTGPSPFKTAVKATSHHVKTDPVAAKRFEDAIEEIRKEGEDENDRCMREYGTLDCPACGGSGHIGDVAQPETKLDRFLAMARVWVERDGGDMDAALAWMYGDVQQAQVPETCMWTQIGDEFDGPVWESTCGELWSFIDGGPKENRVSYCHHCGKKVELPAAPELKP